MATAIILPKQGQSVETCIITEWYKKKGDRVEKGDLLFAYETDKSSFEEEAKVEGVLLEIYFGEGDEVPVLSEVALIGEEGENAEKPAVETAAGNADDKVAGTAPSRLRISPRARKMAEARGVDIRNLQGSGPNGRIIVRDIEMAGTAAAAVTDSSTEVPPRKVPVKQPAVPGTGPTPPGTTKPEPGEKPLAPGTAATAAADGKPEMDGDWEDLPLTNMRRLISKAMHASLQNSAQLTHHLSADARRILSLRSMVKKMQEEGYAHNITLNDMVCFAVVRALKKHPGANVHFQGDSIRRFRKVHLGIAVDTDRGLMVPVLRNADDLSLAGLSGQVATLAAAARSGKIDPDLLQPEAATFTVSNLGAYGVEMFTPVINLPQAGILGVNTIVERPAKMEDGTFGFVPYIGLSLTYDHRALDGGPATNFLAEIKKEIEQFDHDLIKL